MTLDEINDLEQEIQRNLELAPTSFLAAEMAYINLIEAVDRSFDKSNMKDEAAISEIFIKIFNQTHFYFYSEGKPSKLLHYIALILSKVSNDNFWLKKTLSKQDLEVLFSNCLKEEDLNSAEFLLKNLGTTNIAEYSVAWYVALSNNSTQVIDFIFEKFSHQGIGAELLLDIYTYIGPKAVVEYCKKFNLEPCEFAYMDYKRQGASIFTDLQEITGKPTSLALGAKAACYNNVLTKSILANEFSIFDHWCDTTENWQKLLMSSKNADGNGILSICIENSEFITHLIKRLESSTVNVELAHYLSLECAKNLLIHTNAPEQFLFFIDKITYPTQIGFLLLSQVLEFESHLASKIKHKHLQSSIIVQEDILAKSTAALVKRWPEILEIQVIKNTDIEKSNLLDRLIDNRNISGYYSSRIFEEIYNALPLSVQKNYKTFSKDLGNTYSRAQADGTKGGWKLSKLLAFKNRKSQLDASLQNTQVPNVKGTLERIEGVQRKIDAIKVSMQQELNESRVIEIFEQVIESYKKSWKSLDVKTDIMAESDARIILEHSILNSIESLAQLVTTNASEILTSNSTNDLVESQLKLINDQIQSLGQNLAQFRQREIEKKLKANEIYLEQNSGNYLYQKK